MLHHRFEPSVVLDAVRETWATYTAGPGGRVSGALSIGVPVFSTAARVVDDDGADLPPGAVGEIVISGPQAVPGY